MIDEETLKPKNVEYRPVVFAEVAARFTAVIASNPPIKEFAMQMQPRGAGLIFILFITGLIFILLMLAGGFAGQKRAGIIGAFLFLLGFLLVSPGLDLAPESVPPVKLPVPVNDGSGKGEVKYKPTHF